MATYAIGDLQGCYREFIELLEVIDFTPGRDTLWLVGDLVNRGPQSLEVLRYLHQIREHCVITLGNHDLHMLAVFHGKRSLNNSDTLDELLAAKDCAQLCDWLQQQPLMHVDEQRRLCLSHAGVYPGWEIATAKQLATEASQCLQNPTLAPIFFENMFGNEPNTWSNALEGWERLRFVINAFTRMRLCNADGSLSFGDSTSSPLPWFEIATAREEDYRIIFGHWASLGGAASSPNVEAIDTGCVWGRSLTALNIDTGVRQHVPSQQPPRSK